MSDTLICRIDTGDMHTFLCRVIRLFLWYERSYFAVNFNSKKTDYMAVIMKIRNKFGILIVGVIALAIVAFLLQDAINSNTSVLRPNSNVAGVIDGKTVSISKTTQIYFSGHL